MAFVPIKFREYVYADIQPNDPALSCITVLNPDGSVDEELTNKKRKAVKQIVAVRDKRDGKVYPLSGKNRFLGTESAANI